MHNPNGESVAEPQQGRIRMNGVVDFLNTNFACTSNSAVIFLLFPQETSSNAEVLASDLPASPCIAVLGEWTIAPGRCSVINAW